MTAAQNFSLILSTIFLANPLFAAKNDVIATVGKEKITQGEFDKRYKEVEEKTVNPPSKKVFLQDVIQYKMGVQEAKRRKLMNDPVLKERVNQELYKILVERGITGQISKIRVNEKEMKAWYKKNPNIRTSHILIELKPDANKKQNAEARKRALEILKEVKKSKRSFPELVKLYTDDSMSKNIGGDLGYQNSQTLDPGYYKAAMKLRKGQVSNLVKTKYGYHIIKLTGKQSYKKASKRMIRAYVFEDKKRKIFKKFFAKTKKEIPCENF